jgi:hypothetical protein
MDEENGLLNMAVSLLCNFFLGFRKWRFLKGFSSKILHNFFPPTSELPVLLFAMDFLSTTEKNKPPIPC